MPHVLCLLGFIGDITFKMDDVFVINKNGCILFIYCKCIAKCLA